MPPETGAVDGGMNRMQNYATVLAVSVLAGVLVGRPSLSVLASLFR